MVGILIKPADPLTIKGLYKTNHTFTTKLYPLQLDYCIQIELLSNIEIRRNKDYKRIMKFGVLAFLLEDLMRLGKYS